MHSGKVLLLAGISGTGKSNISRRIIAREQCQHVRWIRLDHLMKEGCWRCFPQLPHLDELSKALDSKWYRVFCQPEQYFDAKGLLRDLFQEQVAQCLPEPVQVCLLVEGFQFKEAKWETFILEIVQEVFSTEFEVKRICLDLELDRLREHLSTKTFVANGKLTSEDLDMKRESYKAVFLEREGWEVVGSQEVVQQLIVDFFTH